MSPGDRKGGDDLRVLDRYLSLRAGHVFGKTHCPAARRSSAAAAASSRQHRNSAAIALLVASAGFVFAMLGQAGTGPVEIPSLRGSAGHMEGLSRWRGDALLELVWSPVPEASHYSLRVLDSRGGLIVSRVLEQTETVVTVEVGAAAQRPVLWTVVAWQNTRRLAASDVLTSVAER